MTPSRSSMVVISWEKGESLFFPIHQTWSDQVGSLFSLLERTDDLETSTSRSISHFKIGEISADPQPRTTQVFRSSSTRCQTTRCRYSRPNQLAGGLFRLIPPLLFLGSGDMVSPLSFLWWLVVWIVLRGLWALHGRTGPDGMDLSCGQIVYRTSF